MKTSVEIPDDLWKAAKHLAVEEEIDLKDVIVKALEEFLKREQKKGGKGK